jgi:hypothetical protein
LFKINIYKMAKENPAKSKSPALVPNKWVVIEDSTTEDKVDVTMAMELRDGIILRHTSMWKDPSGRFGLRLTEKGFYNRNVREQVFDRDGSSSMVWIPGAKLTKGKKGNYIIS